MAPLDPVRVFGLEYREWVVMSRNERERGGPRVGGVATLGYGGLYSRDALGAQDSSAAQDLANLPYTNT